MSCPSPPYALAQVFVAWPQCWWSGADGSSLLGAQHTLLVGNVRGRWPLLTIVSDGHAAPRCAAEEEGVLSATASGEEALSAREDRAPRSQQAVLCATAVGEEARRVESLPESP